MGATRFERNGNMRGGYSHWHQRRGDTLREGGEEGETMSRTGLHRTKYALQQLSHFD
ncbi:hypothetical protein A2U01_0025163, partial [Trifolium medium]|nr:hypothetical protein [Trifolium medium]